MHIGVIIPAYNAEAWLPACLRSLRLQTDATWSAIVVDDGSTDDTAAVAAAQPDDRVQVIRQPNAGVSAARNHGIRVALARTGQQRVGAFLFLDADDWLCADALSRLGAALREAPWAVAAAGGHAIVRGNGRILRASPPPSGSLVGRLLVRNLFVNGGQLLICREAVEAAGFFNQDLTFGEDWEYWTRLAALGEFVSLRQRPPVLFAREVGNSAYRRMATDPQRADAVLRAIYANPDLRGRFNVATLDLLRGKAEAENAWIIGRERIRHGQEREGQQWLRYSLRRAPSPKRAALLLLARLHFGPFRPYGFAGPDSGSQIGEPAAECALATMLP